MSWEEQFLLGGRLLLAVLLGSLIGLDRELRGRDAGLGTFAIVTLGACLFGMLSYMAVDQADQSRIAAAVVTGISFLGAGVILRGKRRVSELTTSAALWTAAAVGLAVGLGLYLLAILTAAICIAILAGRHIPSVERWLHANQNRLRDREQQAGGYEPS